MSFSKSRLALETFMNSRSQYLVYTAVVVRPQKSMPVNGDAAKFIVPYTVS